MSGKCLSELCTDVTSNNSTSTYSYIGHDANTFKERNSNHILSFINQKYELNTNPSKHIWDIKRKDLPYKIGWSII